MANQPLPFTGSFTEVDFNNAEAQELASDFETPGGSLLICDITHMWIVKQGNGKYYTTMPGEDFTGSLSGCMNFLQKAIDAENNFY